MIAHTVETEVGLNGLVQAQVPGALEGKRVRVTVEELDVADLAPAAARESKDAEREACLDEFRKSYAAREITQEEFSMAFVELLQRYDAKNPDAPSKERVLGRWKGRIHILPGFDDPIEGLEWAYE